MNLIETFLVQSRQAEGFLLAGSMATDVALVGAAVIDGHLRGCLVVNGGTLRVVDRSSTKDRVFDAAMEDSAAHDGRSVQEAIESLSRTLPRRVMQAARAEGVVETSWSRFMVIVPYRVTRPTDQNKRKNQHDELVQVLEGELPARPELASTLLLLDAAGAAERSFGGSAGDRGIIRSQLERVERDAVMSWPAVVDITDAVRAASRRLRSSGDAAAATG